MFANYVKAIQSNLDALIADDTDARAIDVTRGMLSDMIYEELLDKIEHTQYNNWEEQEACLAKIREYRNGKRWNRKEAN